jgi:capsular exopolysaccharide synthesis family protein
LSDKEHFKGSYEERYLRKGGKEPMRGSYEDEERYLNKNRPPFSKSYATGENRRRPRSLPHLSNEVEGQIEANYEELIKVEGNILSVKRDAKTIYVTSCFTSEGKTISSLSIAYALSVYAGKKVLLIDGNSYAPQIHKLFNIQEFPGFRDFLDSNMGFTEVIQDTQYENLTIMTIGKPAVQKNVSGGIIKRKLDEIRNQFDYIVFDGSSVLESSESIASAVNFDAVILVIACEKTKWETLQIAGEKIRSGGGTVLGVVLNRRRYYVPESIYRKV